MTNWMPCCTLWRINGFGFPVFGRSRWRFWTRLREKGLRKNCRDSRDLACGVRGSGYGPKLPPVQTMRG